MPTQSPGNTPIAKQRNLRIFSDQPSTHSTPNRYDGRIPSLARRPAVPRASVHITSIMVLSAFELTPVPTLDHVVEQPMRAM